ncbi:MAG: multidrug efflux RND transporter permease subunit [Rhodospirillaceae bacterium]|nr:multidrug efflux RND transporter permease subunit [Rhodospirillaceae bacterium]MBT6205337.1 multidrug efflux RND transporter permease subunit [Rhodospirillaceae bacterium]MBT6510227.1 multidrug efflux RND transporter permease subunit [Rhodospirillaceae bacterium]MBT7648707.1 multidrug efflux RND transporter permease subunit [Rhodospirillaceae bacterium]
MFSLFFIDRPKFAFVISILITIGGLISLSVIPVAEFPEISPPQISVSASYPGASVEVVEATVAEPIEAQVNGVEGMTYMSSSSSGSGTYSLSISFDLETDPDIAAVNVQNRVATAESALPEEVRRGGVTVTKASTSMLMVISIYSPGNKYDSLFLSNYTNINIRDALVRVPGVGDAGILGGQDYGMRIWLDPNRMSALSLTPADVVSAITAQNIQATAGQIGAPPIADDQQFQYSIIAEGRLATPEDFGEIIIVSDAGARDLQLKDIARIELGAATYNSYSQLNGLPAAALAIYQLPGANALNVAEAVQAELDRLAQRFPGDVEYKVIYDTTRYVQTTIDEVVITLLVAFLLVVAVTYVFMQDWRATLVPTLAIPVSLIGTFMVMLMMGYSANTISLFAMFLAIGVVVDDAIVVVENVQRIMAEEGLKAREATRKAMQQISGAVIATTLVLLAVFVPVAFLPGLTGRIYQQFAVTISVAVVISSFNALTLSPALCAMLMRPERLRTRGPLGLFNRGFNSIRTGYVGLVGVIARRAIIGLAILAGIYAVSFGLFTQLPSGFMPNEDRGAFFVDIQLPDAAAFPRTEEVIGHVEEILVNTPGVADVISIPGFSLLGSSGQPNVGMAVVALEPWDDRTDPSLSINAILRKVQGQLSAISEANIFGFAPPPIPGLGLTGGFDFRLQDVTGQSPQDLAQAMGALVYSANQDPDLQNVFGTYRADVPQLFLDIDRDKAEALAVPLADIFTVLQAYLGAYYVNDFNYLGRIFRVTIQAESEFRSAPDDIKRLYVRSLEGDMVPLGALLTVETILGPESLSRYNTFRTVTINGSPAPGKTTGEAIAAMEEITAAELPEGFAYEWSGQTLEEIESAGTTTIIFALGILFVYLFLVAQYESWTLPLVVILSVPSAALGALFLTSLLGAPAEVNLYTQIGLVLLIGLASKNAILIAEFARDLRSQGHSVMEAAISASRLRFRAILMTSFSFILGVFPLVIATGAGSGSRRAVGNVVLGGMSSAVIFGIFLVPVLYVLIQGLVERAMRRKDNDDTEPVEIDTEGPEPEAPSA